VDLAGLVIADENLSSGATSADVLVPWGSGDTLLPAGGFALVIDPDYDGGYELPGDVVLLTTEDAGIGNGLGASNDAVILFDADGATVIDSYSFPFNPGNGVSVERADLSDGDVDGNWVVSACGHSAGLPNCGE